MNEASETAATESAPSSSFIYTYRRFACNVPDDELMPPLEDENMYILEVQTLDSGAIGCPGPVQAPPDWWTGCSERAAT